MTGIRRNITTKHVASVLRHQHILKTIQFVMVVKSFYLITLLKQFVLRYVTVEKLEVDNLKVEIITHVKDSSLK